jgi:hypothetical protein
MDAGSSVSRSGEPSPMNPSTQTFEFLKGVSPEYLHKSAIRGKKNDQADG